MLIDLLLEIHEVRVLADAAKPAARNRQLGLVTLAATKRALEALPFRSIVRRTPPAPRAKLFRFREGREECLEVGDGLIAQLCFRVGGHQPIGLAQRVPDLRLSEAATRKVRSPGAFGLDSVTVLAHLSLPEGLARIGSPDGSRFGPKLESALQRRRCQHDRGKDTHMPGEVTHVETPPQLENKRDGHPYTPKALRMNEIVLPRISPSRL